MSSYNLDQSEYCPECEERLDNGKHRVDYIRATRIDPEEYRVICGATPQPEPRDYWDKVDEDYQRYLDQE